MAVRAKKARRLRLLRRLFALPVGRDKSQRPVLWTLGSSISSQIAKFRIPPGYSKLRSATDNNLAWTLALSDMLRPSQDS